MTQLCKWPITFSFILVGFPIRIRELRIHFLVLHTDAVVGLVANDCAILEHVAVLLRVLLNPHRRQLRDNSCMGTNCKLLQYELIFIAAGGHNRMARLQAVCLLISYINLWKKLLFLLLERVHTSMFMYSVLYNARTQTCVYSYIWLPFNKNILDSYYKFLSYNIPVATEPKVLYKISI